MLLVGHNIFMCCSACLIFDLQWAPSSAKIEVSSNCFLNFLVQKINSKIVKSEMVILIGREKTDDVTSRHQIHVITC
jgi:hypothetical protein